MPALDYLVYDVFTDHALAGNPLAVVLDAKWLDDDAMQRIAAEFNLSETVFVLPPQDAAHRAKIRIFTPHYEMPFAGHPTVGTAIALAECGGDAQGIDAEIVVLEEEIGLVRCVVTRGEGAPFAEFGIPQLPEQGMFEVGPGAVAAALGLDVREIGFDNHRPALWSAGVPYVTVPVSGLAAARRLRFDVRAWREFAPRKGNGAWASAYVYCRETDDEVCAFHARMFTAGDPPYEDPATGSAAAAFAGVVVAFERPHEGTFGLWIEQGIEMGRPSRIRLDIDVVDGGVASARIGGHAVMAAEGRLFV